MPSARRLKGKYFELAVAATILLCLGAEASTTANAAAGATSSTTPTGNSTCTQAVMQACLDSNDSPCLDACPATGMHGSSCLYADIYHGRSDVRCPVLCRPLYL